MRWAVLAKDGPGTISWVRVFFYGRWLWAYFATFEDKATALQTLNRVKSSNSTVEFTLMPTDLRRAPGT